MHGIQALISSSTCSRWLGTVPVHLGSTTAKCDSGLTRPRLSSASSLALSLKVATASGRDALGYTLCSTPTAPVKRHPFLHPKLPANLRGEWREKRALSPQRLRSVTDGQHALLSATTDDPMAYDKFQNRSLEEQPRLIKGHELVLLLFRRAEQYGRRSIAPRLIIRP
ncbi:hypothetical protein TsFJ059_007178 [Trichoderma semiorbis]|uniref:Uncharacterized protein n=1 Tax=Trichoderma semiorbis TaxID=1491008 RepID=A0A9P8HND0_9HYPO|nr:hypothetical protein TsFJ059_007178 [Trichoderma semiorbis]